MLTAVGYVDTHISIGKWDNINNHINHFLDYADTHTYDKLTYHNSDMHIWVHTDAPYLTETKSISRAGGYHYFRKKTKNFIQSYDPPPKHNHPVLILLKVIDAVMISTQ